MGQLLGFHQSKHHQQVHGNIADSGCGSISSKNILLLQGQITFSSISLAQMSMKYGGIHLPIEIYRTATAVACFSNLNERGLINYLHYTISYLGERTKEFAVVYLSIYNGDIQRLSTILANHKRAGQLVSQSQAWEGMAAIVLMSVSWKGLNG